MAGMLGEGDLACTTISIVNDTTLEGPHGFDVMIMGSVPPLMTADTLTSVNIIDDEGKVFCILL